MSPGKQVLLYLVDGKPGGLRTAEIANWTGHVVAAPRSELSRLLLREETRRSGVYLLLGDDPESSQPGRARVYIGESDEVATRLRQHHDKKDWWDRAVIVTSQAQAQQLTKSQVRYLESQLIARAKQTARAVLDNGTDPGFSRLSEAETSNMDYFLDQLHVLLPTIGVDVFRGLPRVTNADTTAPESAVAESPMFFLRGKRQGIEARARLADGEFIVLAGSTAVTRVSESATYSESTARAYASYRSIHDGLVSEDVLVVDGTKARFVKDAAFGSSSTAGAVVLGRSCNGRTSWVTAEGISFGAWEGRGLVNVDSVLSV
ncbi:MAG: GIY-YIG nuclease family protein [Microbacteriaceae bacterium]|nr:MAG: GIY-YIG nuclease family protein [Microbacteriaceae bacterium]